MPKLLGILHVLQKHHHTYDLREQWGAYHDPGAQWHLLNQPTTAVIWSAVRVCHLGPVVAPL